MRMKLGTLKRIIREAVMEAAGEEKEIMYEPGDPALRQWFYANKQTLGPDEMPTHVMLDGVKTLIPPELRGDKQFLGAYYRGDRALMKTLIDKHNSSQEFEAQSSLDYSRREMARPRDIRVKIAWIERDLNGHGVIPGMSEGDLKKYSLSMVEKLENHLDYVLEVQTLVPGIGSLTGQALEAAVEKLKDDEKVQKMADELREYHAELRRQRW